MQMSMSTAVTVFLRGVNKLIVMGNVVGRLCLNCFLQIPCLVGFLQVEFVNSITRLHGEFSVTQALGAWQGRARIKDTQARMPN